MKYYFTLRHNANPKERAEAKKYNAVLVNGMFGYTFNKPCEKVYGNAPEHLKHLLPKKRTKKEAV